MLKLKDVLFKLNLLNDTFPSLEVDGDVQEIIDFVKENTIKKPWFVFSDNLAEGNQGGMTEYDSPYETEEDANEFIESMQDMNHKYETEYYVVDIRQYGED